MCVQGADFADFPPWTHTRSPRCTLDDPSARDWVPHERPRLGECPDPLDAHFPADAGLAAAAERQAWVLRGQAVAVDADGARHELPRDPVRESVVTGPHRRGKAEFGCVGCGYGVIDVVVAEDRQHRAEQLL